MTNFSTQPPRGMRDFYPEDYLKREALFGVLNNAALSYGFSSYDAPVVETLDIFKRKAGDEVVKQLYEFKDKGGRELALRPEMTPSMVRMVAGRLGSMKLPIKWSAIAQCFRYERMTTGRKREHYQLNLDVLGDKNQTAEAELIATAIAVLKDLGLSEQDVTVRFNSRKVLADLLKTVISDESSLQTAFLILDKRGKITDQEIREMMEEEKFSSIQIDKLFEILAIENFEEVKALSPDSEGVREMENFLTYAKEYKISEWLEFDIGIIRGLSYYTGIVFEAFDKNRKFRAIFGGGRYDNLFKNLAGIDLPAAGLGFGDVVIMDLLEDLKKPIKIKENNRYFIFATDEKLISKAIEISQKLREEGSKVYLHPQAMRMGKGLTFASEEGFFNCIILDPRDIESGFYIQKDLKTGEQSQIKL